MVIEGIVEERRWGDIAVDDIKVLDGLSMQDCKGESFGLCFHFLHSHELLGVTSFLFFFFCWGSLNSRPLSVHSLVNTALDIYTCTVNAAGDTQVAVG